MEFPEIDHEISKDEFFEAAKVFHTSSNSDEIKVANEILILWQQQTTSIEESIKNIQDSNDFRVNFFSAKCIQYFVRKNYHIFSQDSIIEIIRLLVSSITANELMIERSDISFYILLLADLCCINPDLLYVADEFSIDTKILFLTELFSEYYLPFVTKYDMENRIKFFLKGLKGTVMDILIEKDVSKTWFRLFLSSISFFGDDEIIIPLLPKVFSVYNNEELFPNLLNYGDYLFSSDTLDNNLIIETIKMFIEVCNEDNNLAAKNGCHIYSSILGYGNKFFESCDEDDLYLYVIQSFFDNISKFLSPTDEFFDCVHDAIVLLKYLCGWKEHVFLEIFFNLFYVMIQIVDFDPSFACQGMEKLFLSFQANNSDDTNNKFAEIYLSHINNLSTGMILAASVYPYWDQKTEVGTAILKKVLSMDNLPISALRLFARMTSYRIVQDMIPDIIRCSISFFEELPVESASLLKTLSLYASESMAVFLPDLSEYFLPVLSQLSLQCQSLLIIMFILLISNYEYSSIEILQFIGNSIITTSQKGVSKETSSSIISTLGFIEDVANGSNQAQHNQELEEFFDLLAKSLFELFGPFLYTENDTIQEHIAKCLYQIVSSKWIREYSFVIEYVENVLPINPIPHHFVLLDLFPELSLSERIVRYMFCIEINDSQELITSMLNHCTKIIQSNPYLFWSVISPEFIIRFLRSNGPTIIDACLNLSIEALRQESPPEFFDHLISTIIEQLTVNFTDGNQKKAFEILLIMRKKPEKLMELIFSILPRNNSQADRLIEELSKDSPNRVKLMTCLKNLISVN